MTYKNPLLGFDTILNYPEIKAGVGFFLCLLSHNEQTYQNHSVHAQQNYLLRWHFIVLQVERNANTKVYRTREGKIVRASVEEGLESVKRFTTVMPFWPVTKRITFFLKMTAVLFVKKQVSNPGNHSFLNPQMKHLSLRKRRFYTSKDSMEFAI